MAKLEITVDDVEVIAALNHIIAIGERPRPLLLAIGESLEFSTKRRFETSTAPDGSSWAPNAESTFLSYLGAFKGSTTKKGKLSKKGIERAINKKPLIGETRSLSSNITYQLIGDDTLEVGSPQVYAGTQQFGAKKGEFGKTRRGASIPWGDIPAREFLGLSADDRRTVLDIVQQFLTA